MPTVLARVVAAQAAAQDPTVGVRGLVPAGGATRHHLTCHRNAVAFRTADTFNLTNAVTVT